MKIVKIALTVDSGAYFKSQYELAKVLERDSRFTVSLYFTLRYNGDEKHHSQSRDKNLKIYLPKQAAVLAPTGFSIINMFITLLNTGRRYYIARREWAIYCKNYKPTIVILPAENRFLQNLHSYFCDRRKIPVVVAPLWVAGKEELIEASIGVPVSRRQHVVGRVIAIFSQKYLHRRDFDSKKILATTWDNIICQFLFRCSPKKPWVLHDGRSTVIAIESKGMFEAAVASGLDPNKMQITGSVFHDLMASAKNKLSIKPEVTAAEVAVRILVAIPPDMFYLRGIKGLEYESYLHVISHWFSLLESLENVKVTYCLHPSALEMNLPLKEIEVSKEPIEILIPEHDLFIASISSTIQWALSAGLFVVDFDLYKYHYPTYLSESRVKTCHTIAEFEDAINTTVLHIRTVDLKFPQEYWGVIDGLASDRIKSLLNSLAVI